MADLRITEARRRALRAVVSGGHHGPVRVSNVTKVDGPRSAVYWQTARWLVDEHLADPVDAGGGGPFGAPRRTLVQLMGTDRVAGIELTDQGRALAVELGIERGS